MSIEEIKSVVIAFLHLYPYLIALQTAYLRLSSIKISLDLVIAWFVRMVGWGQI